MKPQRRSRESGVAIYITAVLLVMIVPMVGLAIDSTLLYIVKTRLQGAVDGAALAAARGLSRGSDDASQIAAAKTAGKTYVMLNYPTGFLFSNNVSIDATNGVSIDTSVAHQRTVTVTATVTQPTLFMRWLNFTSTTVVATAQTTRKDVNVVLVLDRSGSMTTSGSCTPMKAAAINFLANFASGRDQIGIISFATSVVVQMPLTSSFNNNDGSNVGMNTTTVVNNLNCQGSTSSAAALWTAYDQLVRSNQGGALNYITFFTDGEPTGVAVNMPIATTSPCTETTYTVSASGTPPPGLPSGYTGKYIPGLYAVFTNGSAFIGNAKYWGLANSTTGALDSTIINSNDQVVADQSQGCAYAVNWGSSGPDNTNWQKTSDFRGIPTKDVFGNDLVNQSYNPTTSSGSYIAITNPANGLAMATNAADSAAKRIRTGTTDQGPNGQPWPFDGVSAPNRGLSGVIIHSIGLGNAPVPITADDTFLQRVSNTTASPTYDSNYGSGVYMYAPTAAELGQAFQHIASEILRLSK